MSQSEIMQCDRVKEYKAWFSSGLELPEIGEKFKSIGLITEFDIDYENVYEWFVGKTESQQIELNVSRKHCDFEGFEEEPIHIMLMYGGSEPENVKVDAIAKSICKAFKVDVNVGFIDYVEGDNFEYRRMSDLLPKNSAMTRMRFPINLRLRRSQNEEETVQRRTDNRGHQEARCRCKS